MGNHHNLSSEDKKKLIQNINFTKKNANYVSDDTGKNSFLEIITKQSSSYKGIRTVCNHDSDRAPSVHKDFINKGTEPTTNCSSLATNVSVDYTNFKIPTLFEWKEPSGVVYLTGSFSNWNQRFILSKKADDRFELVLELPRKRYEYKFIVDNKWCFSKHHPICKDEKGNINNFIDTTNWDISKYIPEKDKIKQKIKQDEEINITKVEEYSFSKRRTKQKSSLNIIFSNKYPSRTEFNLESGKTPQNYKNSFYLSRLKYLKDKFYPDQPENFFFIKRKDVDYFGENISFSSLPVPLHINLYENIFDIY